MKEKQNAKQTFHLAKEAQHLRIHLYRLIYKYVIKNATDEQTHTRIDFGLHFAVALAFDVFQFA